jgi:glutamate/tyrosine decarboxylase-like PLP-dependent enzyme
LSDVKIVGINFAYHNHELIGLLSKRGAAITSLTFEDGGFPFYAKSIATLDAALTDLIKDETKYEMIAQPVCAFITFESDDGRNEALIFCE